MSSEKTNFVVYIDIKTERYKETTLKNAKEENWKISKWTACKPEIMAPKTVSGALTFYHFNYCINKATKCCIQSKSVMPSLAKQNKNKIHILQVPMDLDRNLVPNLSNSFLSDFFTYSKRCFVFLRQLP